MIAKIKIETHIIENLKINLLLEIDNLVSQEVVINFIKQQAIIDACSNVEWPWVGYSLYGMVKIPKWVVPTPTKMRKMGTTHF